MRKVVLSVANSLDNYIARLDGGFDWILHDQDHGLGEFFKSVDTVLMGRKVHDMMVRMGSPCYPGMKNFVFSRTKTGTGKGGVMFVSETPTSFVEKLRDETGKDIWLSGGAELIQTFLQENLIDQIALAVQPVLLGEGMPLFPPGFPETKLHCTASKRYPSGVVTLTYEVLRQSTKQELERKNRSAGRRNPS
jgi:dihydrofolate reductase